MIARPDHLTVSPNPTTAVSMDPLSDVLRAVRLTGSVFLSGHFTAPWCIGVEITPDECAPHLPGRPAQIIGYHVVVEGRMHVGVDSEPPVEVSAGEIVLFPQNDPHILADRRGVRPISASELIQRSPDGGLNRIVHGGRRRRDADRVRISCERGLIQSALLNVAQGAQDRRARGCLARVDRGLCSLCGERTRGRQVGLFERSHSALRVAVDRGGSSVRVDSCRGQGRLASRASKTPISAGL